MQGVLAFSLPDGVSDLHRQRRSNWSIWSIWLLDRLLGPERDCWTWCGQNTTIDERASQCRGRVSPSDHLGSTTL